MTMTNITKILSNLRRKGIENKNALVCPHCGHPIDMDYLMDDISDNEFGIYWEHKKEEINTNGDKVVITQMRQYPQNEYHVPKYMEIYTRCRGVDDDEMDCDKSFTVRFYIVAQEIID